MKCWICGENAINTLEQLTLSPEGENLIRYNTKISFIEELRIHEGINKRHYCNECLKNVKNQYEKDTKEYIRLKKKLMFERAIRIFERQNIDISEYKEAIDAVKEFSEENQDKFDSSHEILAAIILIYNEIQTKTQYKIDKYKVDFLLPGLKVVLEIDGGFHKHTLFRDNNRDIKIREILGREWETVRIGTEYIEQNAELLVEAIKTIKAEKQKIRRQNYGILPEWYSKRQKAKKPKKQIIGDDFLLDD